MAQAKRAGEQELSSKRGQQAQQSSEAHRANPSGKCEATSALLPPSAKLECRGVLTRGGLASAPRAAPAVTASSGPGGSGQRGTPRARPGHCTPRHGLGRSSEPPPKPPDSFHRLSALQVGRLVRAAVPAADGPAGELRDARDDRRRGVRVLTRCSSRVLVNWNSRNAHCECTGIVASSSVLSPIPSCLMSQISKCQSSLTRRVRRSCRVPLIFLPTLLYHSPKTVHCYRAPRRDRQQYSHTGQTQ